MEDGEFERKFAALIAERVRSTFDSLTRERNEAIRLMLEASTHVDADDPLYERIRDWHITFCVDHPDWRPHE